MEEDEDADDDDDTVGGKTPKRTGGEGRNTEMSKKFEQE